MKETIITCDLCKQKITASQRAVLTLETGGIVKLTKDYHLQCGLEVRDAIIDLESER